VAIRIPMVALVWVTGMCAGLEGKGMLSFWVRINTKASCPIRSALGFTVSETDLQPRTLHPPSRLAPRETTKPRQNRVCPRQAGAKIIGTPKTVVRAGWLAPNSHYQFCNNSTSFGSLTPPPHHLFPFHGTRSARYLYSKTPQSQQRRCQLITLRQ